ncbi:uncharacterized protein LOC125214143 [Salvia hispanica]|uniref:uncharacterized protein LOC125214143 n=1 Tax=Salvia hispanica TaxID=49212 RepID=UPI0020099D12|nr:uncharacterized protein LOC125214143 [Salvia hispanica]
MKRGSGDDGEGENLELKKLKLFSGSDQNYIDLDSLTNEGEEEGVFAESRTVNGEHVDRNLSHFGNVVPNDFDGLSLGGLGGSSNMWDYDLNFDMFFKGEGQGLPLDLNIPLHNPSPNRNKGLLAYDQYPDERLVSKGKEVVDLVSDDDDSDVEIVGYTCGYNQQIESGERLSLGLGLPRLDNGIGESSLAASGAYRYTDEEKGKGSDMNSWLSLKGNSFFNLDSDTDNDEPVQLIEPNDGPVELIEPPLEAVEGLEAMLLQEEVLARRAAMAPRDQENRRRAARQLARVNIFDENRGDQPSTENQQPPAPNPMEGLGKLPGPFGDALKMVRERTSKRAAEQLIEWSPSVKDQQRSVAAPFVPSLLNISLKALAECAEGMVSLKQVPDNLRVRLTNRLCDKGLMNVGFLNFLVEGSPTEIRIKNCSWLTEEQFQQTIVKCETDKLQVLQLDLCGQCMLDIAFKDILNKNQKSFSRLTIMSVRGACRLSDDGLRNLVKSAPLLRSINLGQCTLLTSDSVNCIADFLGSDLRELYIDECNKIDAMKILPAFKKFRYLEVLSVAEIHTINDQFVDGLVTACGQSLKDLDFANCVGLTDCSLQTIGKSCADLCSLNISNLNNLTDLGLEHLANGCRSIQKLKLRHNEFSDEAVAAFLESSGEALLELLLNNMAMVGPLTALSVAKRSRKLLTLDVSWCRKISNEALGLIVDSCSSLKLLKIFGCRQITAGFLQGHSNPLVRIIGSNFTPLMDHLDLLEPEEMFLRYSPLPVFSED